MVPDLVRTTTTILLGKLWWYIRLMCKCITKILNKVERKIAYILLSSNEIGVSATITLPVPQIRRANKLKHDSSWFDDYENHQRAKSQHMQQEGNDVVIKDSEGISTEENIDNEEDENTDCLNEEVEGYFSVANQEHVPGPSRYGNR